MAFTVPIWFLNEIELYKTVKPYRLDFEPEDDDFPRTNVERVEVPNVPILDIRTYGKQLRFPECGFSILPMPLELTVLPYDDEQSVIDQYYPYLERVAQDFSSSFKKGAKAVALDHKVRKRHADFPVSTGENYTHPQPVMVAHVDWTPESIGKKLRDKLGDEKAESIQKGHYQFCHAWKPIIGPLTEYPLAMCDFSSVDPETDYELCDDVHMNHGVDENYLVYNRPGHKWYYISNQEPTEILFFREYDSEIGFRSGTPHCAVQNPIPVENSTPRQSIEVEMVIYWE
ncbi:hypothetical protein QBC44DRAFT_353461 [Cladorrhinum sp. PSN332]|nr:hypothetical protein QBC44DRAFT_353461 [Cladorrhinum sp. PSN332]